MDVRLGTSIALVLVALLSIVVLGCPQAIDIEPPDPNRASLDFLSLSAGTLSPTFSATVYAYQVVVPGATTSISVIASAYKQSSRIESRLNGSETWIRLDSGVASSEFTSDSGVNELEIRVTSDDGELTQHYSIAILRLSSDALLSNLSISDGTLDSAFVPTTLEYAVALAEASTSIQLTPTSSFPGAQIRVRMNGQTWFEIASGTQTQALALQVGDNLAEIQVTSADASAQTLYAIQIRRGSSASSLQVIRYSFVDPVSWQTIYSYPYSASLPHAASTVRILANAPVGSACSIEMRIRGGAWKPLSSGVASGAEILDIGDNLIEVRATSEDESTQTSYDLTLRRKSNNANLSSLSLSSGALVPGFGADTIDYAATVISERAIISATPTKAHASATIAARINGGAWNSCASGSPSSGFALSTGDNVLDLRVRAEDSSIEKFYSIVVRRQDGDATLSSLSIAGSTLYPAFSAGTSSYAANVPAGSLAASLLPVKLTDGGTIRIRSNGGAWIVLPSGDESPDLPLLAPLNVIDVLVTAEDTSRSRHYSITVVPANPGALDMGFKNPSWNTFGSVMYSAVQDDGKVLLGGSITNYSGTAVGKLFRSNPDGGLDTSFHPSGAGFNGDVYDLALQGDGKLVACGFFTSYDGITRNRIARLNSDGSLDTGFLATGMGADDAITALAIQDDGKIVIAGSFDTYNGVTRNKLARLNPDGSLDTDFRGTDPVGAPSVSSIALQSDGKILIGGSFSYFDYTYAKNIARLNHDGSIDTGFAGSVDLYGTIYEIAIQSDGKILLCGEFAQVCGVARANIARLNGDGSLDTGFLASLPGTDASVESLKLQADGKIVIGGMFLACNGAPRGGIARLNSDGTLDAAFGSGQSGVHGGVYMVELLSDGRILLAGYFDSINSIERRVLSALWP